MYMCVTHSIKWSHPCQPFKRLAVKSCDSQCIWLTMLSFTDCVSSTVCTDGGRRNQKPLLQLNAYFLND